MIFLRFGSLESDRQPWHKAAEVFRRTGVKPSSQYNIIARWRQRGFMITSHLKRRGGKKILTPDQVAWVCHPDTLRRMSHLSLRARASDVMNRFGLLSFDWSTLRSYYLANKIKYRKTNVNYISKDDNQQ